MTMTVDELDQETRGVPCRACGQSGKNTDGRWLWVLVNYLVLTGREGERQGKRLHPWLREIRTIPRHPRNPLAIDPPTPEFARLVRGLAGSTLERGSCDYPHEVFAKIVEAAGLPEGWGTCATCGGAGELPEPLSSSNG